MTDAVKAADQIQLAYLKDLRAELQKVYEQGVRVIILFISYYRSISWNEIIFCKVLVVKSTYLFKWSLIVEIVLI